LRPDHYVKAGTSTFQPYLPSEETWNEAIERLRRSEGGVVQSTLGGTSWKELCAEAGKWQDKVGKDFGIDPQSLLGFVMLSNENEPTSLDWLFGYQTHYLRFRGFQADMCGDVLRTNWMDLFFWAVHTCQPELARTLWARVDEPLRAALMAARLTEAKAEATSGRAAEQLHENAQVYEDWAEQMMILAGADYSLEQVALLLLQLPRSDFTVRWRKVKKKPLGIDLAKEEPGKGIEDLAEALKGKTTFSRSEWNAFNITDLRTDHYVKVGENYFQPKWENGGKSSGSVGRGGTKVRKDPATSRWDESPMEAAIGDGRTVACKRFLARRRCREVLLAIFRGRRFVLDGITKEDDKLADKGEQKIARKLALVDLERDDDYFEPREPTFLVDHHHDYLNDFCGWLLGSTIGGGVYLPQEPSKWAGQKLLHFVNVPKVKYFTHSLFAFGYAVLLTGALVGLPPWSGQSSWMHKFGSLQPSHIPSPEYALWAWTVCRLLEESKQLVVMGKDAYQRSEKWYDWLVYFRQADNQIDLVCYVFMIIGAVLRVVCKYQMGMSPSMAAAGDEAVEKLIGLATLSYAVCAIFTFYRLLSIFVVYEEFGILVIIVKRTLYDIMQWFLIAATVSIGFGVAYTLLMPMNTYEFDRPFFQPFYGMLGDFNREQAYSYFGHEHTTIGKSWAVPFLVWIYTFFMTILMVNLLIAQMGARYERMSNEGHETWLLQFVGLVREYKDLRDTLPPPLNVFEWLFDFKHFLYAAYKSIRESELQISELVDPNVGFRLAMRGKTSRYADTLACRLRDAYLEESSRGAMEATAGAKVPEVLHRVETVQKHIENLERLSARRESGSLPRE